MRKAVESAVQRSSYTQAAEPPTLRADRGKARRKERNMYVVVGPKSVYGLQPGNEGELDLTTGEALALIEAGHIKVADRKPPKKETESAPNGRDKKDD